MVQGWDNALGERKGGSGGQWSCLPGVADWVEEGSPRASPGSAPARGPHSQNSVGAEAGCTGPPTTALGPGGFCQSGDSHLSRLKASEGIALVGGDPIALAAPPETVEPAHPAPVFSWLQFSLMVTFPEVPLGILLFCVCVITIGAVQVRRRGLPSPPHMHVLREHGCSGGMWHVGCWEDRADGCLLWSTCCGPQHRTQRGWGPGCREDEAGPPGSSGAGRADTHPTRSPGAEQGLPSPLHPGKVPL